MHNFKFGVRLQKNQVFPLIIATTSSVEHGQTIIVRTEKGEEVGKAIQLNTQIIEQWKKDLPEPIPLIKVAKDKEMDSIKDKTEQERIAHIKCLELIEKFNLKMRLISTSFTYDRKRLTFYFTANSRVDFRDLLKELTHSFRRTRIDLRHIGVRDETAILDGHGLCGRQYCCSSFLKDFDAVNIKLAKDQGLPLNPTKISGSCGRLMCCLNYEYPNYVEAAVGMPPVGCGVMTPEGIGRVCSLHFLNSKAVVKLEDGKLLEFNKNEIEIIDEEVTGIDININQYILQQTNEDDDVFTDLSDLED